MSVLMQITVKVYVNGNPTPIDEEGHVLQRLRSATVETESARSNALRTNGALLFLYVYYNMLYK